VKALAKRQMRREERREPYRRQLACLDHRLQQSWH
jgi:hypothetical protein